MSTIENSPSVHVKHLSVLVILFQRFELVTSFIFLLPFLYVSDLLICQYLKRNGGHKNIETTLQTYSHLYPSRLKDTMMELERSHYNAESNLQKKFMIIF